MKQKTIKADRNKEICELRLQGQTLESIAEQVDLSRERVRQIVKKFEIPTPKRTRKPTTETAFCEPCGKEFLRKRGTKKKYCSPKCRSMAQSHKPHSHYGVITLVCDGCGKTFERNSHAHQIGIWLAKKQGRESKRNFCTPKCYAAFRKNRPTSNPAD